jgi:iron complex outermembrane receptor protein
VKLAKLAQAISLIFVTGAAFAQDVQKGERIEITGSNIKRVQDEGAVPVQIITRKDIDRQGITSVEQLMMTISANGTGADNLSSNVGIQLGTTDRNNNGNTSANLRGLGASSTLVLMNGRRISNDGAKGNAVNLNSIPFTAIERVEILKDGASAIYGTDAIGGVINFILRKDFQGVQLNANTDITQHGGGDIHHVDILAGWGDLAKDRFNVMGTLSFDRQEVLNGNQRSFHNGFQPDRGLSPDTTGTTFASQTGSAGTAMGASFRTPSGGTQTYNRANLLSFQGNCDSVPGQSQYQDRLWGNLNFRYGCAFDYGGSEIIIQPVDRTQFLGRATFQVAPAHTAFAEVAASRSDTTKSFEPYQITTTLLPGANYPVGGPYYQDLSAYISTFNRNLPIAYRWRCADCGNRVIETVTDAYRVLVGMEGVIFDKWDYKVGVSQSGSKAESTMEHGYLYQAPMVAALGSGQVNPWLLPGQSQSAQGAALLDAARADGAKLFAGQSKLTEFDGAVSGEVWQLPGGAVAVAAGFDYRRESYKFDDGSRTVLPIYQAPFDAQFPEVSRTVKAIYGEISVPILKNLEVTAAVRHDDYSDFGGTTNPKVSIRFHPITPLLFRASYNEGFRAPSFFQLYGQQGEGPVPGNIADPVLCPNGNVAGADLSVCAIRPNARQGGNPNLTPETSKQWSAGFVFEPTTWASGSIDAWEIKRKDRIYELIPQDVITHYTTFPENFVRGANGRLDDPGGYIQAGFVNADGDITKGIDLNLRFRGALYAGKWNFNLDGTYIQSFKSRIFVTDPYTELAGQWSNRDIYPRWKHNAYFTYEQGPWSASLIQNWVNPYKDAVPSGVVPPGFDPYVHRYIIYHLTGTYTGFRNTTLTLGVKNLFDKDPPFTAHNLDFAAGAGWDPRVADPRGRSFIARISYKFS